MANFGRAFGTRLASVGVAALLQATWLALYARYEGPSGFGVFSVAYAVGLLIGIALGFGLHSFALRLDYAKADASRTITSMVILRLAAIAAIVATYTLFVATTSDSGRFALAVAVAAVSAELATDLSQGILSGRRRVKTAGVTLMLQRALPAVAAVGITWVQVPPAILPVSLIVSAVIGFAVLLPSGGRPRGFAPIIRNAAPFWGASVVSSLSQLDAPVVGFVAGARFAGLYGAALRLFAPVNLATNALLTVAVPELASADSGEARETLFKRVRRATLWIGAAISVLAYPLALLAVFVLGDEYRPALTFIVAFFIAGALSGVSRAYQANLYAIGRASYVSYAVLGGTLVGLASIPLLAWFVNAAAIAATPILTQVTVLFGMIRLNGRAKREMA